MALKMSEFGLGVVAVHDGMVDSLDHMEDMDLEEDTLVVDIRDNVVDSLPYKVVVDAVEELVDLVEEEAVDLDLVERMVSLELDLLI